MCGRFAIITSAEDLARFFNVDGIFGPDLGLSFNVAPRTQIYAVLEEGDARRLNGLQWGFMPRWAKGLKEGPRPINARSETVASNNLFRYAFSNRRCIIPADGFFEWKRVDGGKQPFFIHRTDEKPIAFAGIWERWTDPNGELETPLDSCAIITTSANEVVSNIHDRMPVVLEPENWDAWLDPENQDSGGLRELLDPAEDHVLEMHPVNPAVGNVRNNSPDLIEPYETDD